MPRIQSSDLPPFRKKTVMSNERIENLESNMQFPLTRLPKIVFRRVEEEFPIWREIVVSAMCLCVDQRGIVWPKQQNVF